MALIKFSEGWTDRDIGMDVAARYEDEAVQYFGYKTPRERKDAMLAAIKAEHAPGASTVTKDVAGSGTAGDEPAAAAGPTAGAGRGAGAGGVAQA